MSNVDILKQYSINIDFLDYEKKIDTTKSIVYSKGDVNSAFIHATLTMGDKIINLENCTVVVNIKNSEGENLTNGCEIVNAKKGIISIPLTSTALSTGFNKFEVVIYTSSRQMVSPIYGYRVAENISNDESIEGKNEYDVLLLLISRVQENLDNIQVASKRVEEIEIEVSSNEEARKSNEVTRCNNEEIRLSNEVTRQTQEANRQVIFDEKVSVVNSKIELIDSELTNINKAVSDKLLQIDEDTEVMVDKKIDDKVSEIEDYIDLYVNEKSDTVFNEANIKVNQKVNEAAESINNVNLKVQEVNTVKNQLVNSVETKIVEVDTSKNNLTKEVNDKIVELEDRFNILASVNPTTEMINAREGIDGTTYESLSQRLQGDFSKKVDGNLVYTKTEIDEKIEDVTSIDDTTTSLDLTWSSSKISNELAKKETITTVQEKVSNAIEQSKLYADEKIAALVGSSPELLNTLDELSNALGNDPNFATTVTNQIAVKADKSDTYTKAEVDRIVATSTSIDDNSINNINTWSSNKINSQLSGKVNVESGKGLSSNDYTKAEKDKLANLNNYVHPNDTNTRHVTDIEKNTWNNKADSNHTHSYSDLNNLPSIPVVDVNKEYVDTELGKKSNSTDVYTKAEMDTKVQDLEDTKANIVHTHNTNDIVGFDTHGNHVPTYETANNLKYLRCDGSWYTIPSATTSVKGVVQLSSSTSSTSTTLGATASAVKSAFDQAKKMQLPTSRPSSVSTGMMWIE